MDRRPEVADAEPEDEALLANEDSLADGSPPTAARRGGRDPWRDLAIPVAAITAVVAAIVLVQLIRERDSPATVAPAAGDDFYSLELGPVDGGKPKLGEPAPGFQLVAMQGEMIRLDAFRGRPVLINFWATWCVPCRKETPELVALQTEWGDTAQIVGVNYYESADAVTEFAANYSVNYPLPLDSDGRVTGSYKLTGLPETYFLDAEGVIRDHRIGQLRPDVARCIVKNLLAGEHEPEECR